MSKNDRLEQLLRFSQAKDFLDQRMEFQDSYCQLIETLTQISDRLQAEKKLTLKIVSPALAIAQNLQAKHEANHSLRSLYQFETVAPISNLRQILSDCDAICLVYAQQHQIREHHHKLIELAQKQNIPLTILVQKIFANINSADYERWQQDLTSLTNYLLPFTDNYWLDFDHAESLKSYQRSLVNLAPQIATQRQDRIAQEAVKKVKSFFNQKITGNWQAINHINSKYCEGQPLHLYQQQFRQNIQTYNQFRQQLIRELKQAVNHAKTDLLNPFAIDGLIFICQQTIKPAAVKIVCESDATYLYLILVQFPQQPFLHNYILELCQQKVDEILAEQWHKINFVYAAGGLKLLAERSQSELNKIAPLLDAIPVPMSQSRQPSLEIRQIIDSYCLKINSRIAFDYSFTQSSWFRLFISLLVGTAIYLSTWLYFGTGKYIGFMIIIFQLINLITGQSIKKARLKQQTKELRRLTEQRYQNLVRTIISYLTQTTITAIDQECQLWEQKYTQAIAIAQAKLDELKQTNEAHKAMIEQLKQDRDQTIAYFDQ